MSRPVFTACLTALFSCLGVLSLRDAGAFPGFYVSGTDTKPAAEASQVVLMRDGTRTVVSIQNDYTGPAESFAMVVPVPVVLQEENVKVLRRDVFDRVERLSAPRLVEYWEQDPCASADTLRPAGSGEAGAGTGTPGADAGHGAPGGTVTIEAHFQVGEYDVVILSAKESSALGTWLRENNYKLPGNAEPALRPYVEAGSKFFVAKVNAAKLKLDSGRTTLSPLRFHYDGEKLELPVRLGMVSSSGMQDLVVYVLAPNQRWTVANHPSVTVSTNLDVTEGTRRSFPAFYAALFDRTLEKNPGAIVTEYAWPSGSCDPCPGGVSGLSSSDLATLGADVLPSTKAAVAAAASTAGPPSVVISKPTTSGGKLSADVISAELARHRPAFRHCYEMGLTNNPNLQGRVQTKFDVDASGAVLLVKDAGSDIPDPTVVECVGRALGRVAFPKAADQKPTAVVTTMVFNTPPASAPRAQAGAARSGGGHSPIGSFVLTRLHTRYAKDALGSDLVFKEAPPIVGGREMRDDKGALEAGAVPGTVNGFQARYAIRHAWSGAVACKEPRRGVWGGPWAEARAHDATVLAAQKLAYAPRANVTLASFVPNGIPELGVAAGAAGAASEADASVTSDARLDPGARDASADAGTAPAGASRCGCHAVGVAADRAGMFGAAALALAAVIRRRRGRPGPM